MTKLNHFPHVQAPEARFLSGYRHFFDTHALGYIPSVCPVNEAIVTRGYARLPTGLHSRAGATPTLAPSTKPVASPGSAAHGQNSGFDSHDGSQLEAGQPGCNRLSRRAHGRGRGVTRAQLQMTVVCQAVKTSTDLAPLYKRARNTQFCSVVRPNASQGPADRRRLGEAYGRNVAAVTHSLRTERALSDRRRSAAQFRMVLSMTTQAAVTHSRSGGVNPFDRCLPRRRHVSKTPASAAAVTHSNPALVQRSSKSAVRPPYATQGRPLAGSVMRCTNYAPLPAFFSNHPDRQRCHASYALKRCPRAP